MTADLTHAPSHLQPVRKHPLQHIRALLSSKQFWGILLTLTVLSQLLAQSRLADGLRGASLDTAARFGTAPSELSDIIVVEIDDETYQTQFDKQLPLNRERLSTLINHLQEAGAAVIGFDMESAGPLPVSGAANVVWAAGLRRTDRNTSNLHAFSGTHFGVARVLRGRDGIVRRYALSTEVDGQSYPTLTAQMARQACLRQPDRWPACTGAFVQSEIELRAHQDHALIRFAPNPQAIPHVPGAYILDVGASTGWRSSNFFRDKLVLIGGTWSESRDEHVTPMGVQFGVYVQAQSIATALGGGGLQEPAGYLLFGVKLIAGVLVGILAAVLSSRWSVFLHLIIVPVCAIAFAVAAVSVNYWIDFIPVLMSGFIHQWFHDVSAHGADAEDSRPPLDVAPPQTSSSPS